MKILALTFLAVVSFSAFAAGTGVRSVYVNGIDISSVRNQSLTHVDVKIDGNGDLYIVAPQYEVQQENTFVPLGQQGISHSSPIEHKTPSALNRKAQAPSADTPAGLATAPETGDTIPKSDLRGVSEEATPPSEKAGTRIAPDARQSPPGSGTNLQ